MVTLESLFDRKDCCYNKDANIKEELSGECEKVNIDTKDNPKLINLDKCCNESEKGRFLKFLKEFRDVFSWSYKDLKDF